MQKTISQDVYDIETNDATWHHNAMKKGILFFSIGFSLLSATSVTSSTANAQSYHGSYNPAPKEAAPKEDKNSIPRIFSSVISDKESGTKVDELYNNLIITVWLYASSDFVLKKNLISLLDKEKFKTTRYKAEFDRPLEKAMNDLNTNYSEMTYFFKDAQEKYQKIYDTLSDTDKAKLQPLWDVEFAKLQAYSKKYFQLENQFLNQYHKMVKFLLEQNGQYTYDSKSQKIRFMDYQDYEYFTQRLDKILQNNYETVTHLKTMIPGNTDIVLSAD